MLTTVPHTRMCMHLNTAWRLSFPPKPPFAGLLGPIRCSAPSHESGAGRAWCGRLSLCAVRARVRVHAHGMCLARAEHRTYCSASGRPATPLPSRSVMHSTGSAPIVRPATITAHHHTRIKNWLACLAGAAWEGLRQLHATHGGWHTRLWFGWPAAGLALALQMGALRCMRLVGPVACHSRYSR